MEKLNAMPMPTRKDLEREASALFDRLALQLDELPATEPDYTPEDQVHVDIEASRTRIKQIDAALKIGQYDKSWYHLAAELVEAAGGEMGSLAPAIEQVAYSIAARAEREQMLLLIHRLTMPASQYVIADNLFDPSIMPPIPSDNPVQLIATVSGVTLSQAIAKPWFGWKSGTWDSPSDLKPAE